MKFKLEVSAEDLTKIILALQELSYKDSCDLIDDLGAQGLAQSEEYKNFHRDVDLFIENWGKQVEEELEFDFIEEIKKPSKSSKNKRSSR
jgi:hypothetical protein